jgi:hypothetical protein
MTELKAQREMVCDILRELSQAETRLDGEHDSTFDVEQAQCACCCSLLYITGATIIC